MSEIQDVVVAENEVWVNGKRVELPHGVHSPFSLTQVNGRLFVNGYEWTGHRWKRTLRAVLHWIF